MCVGGGQAVVHLEGHLHWVFPHAPTCTGCVRPSIDMMAGRRLGPAAGSGAAAPPDVSKKACSRSASKVAEEMSRRRSGRLRCT